MHRTEEVRAGLFVCVPQNGRFDFCLFVGLAVTAALAHVRLVAPQIDYYPSRNNKITVAKIRGHANSTRKLSGQRVSVMIEKENNFYQCAPFYAYAHACPTTL